MPDREPLTDMHCDVFLAYLDTCGLAANRGTCTFVLIVRKQVRRIVLGPKFRLAQSWGSYNVAKRLFDLRVTVLVTGLLWPLILTVAILLRANLASA